MCRGSEGTDPRASKNWWEAGVAGLRGIGTGRGVAQDNARHCWGWQAAAARLKSLNCILRTLETLVAPNH